MSSNNLGIVFGPTLLRPPVSTDQPAVALQENTYQALLVDFLISHHDKVFVHRQRVRTPTPPPAPTGPLPETPPRRAYPLDGDSDTRPEQATSSRDRPYSLEVSFASKLDDGSCCFKSLMMLYFDELTGQLLLCLHFVLFHFFYFTLGISV